MGMSMEIEILYRDIQAVWPCSGVASSDSNREMSTIIPYIFRFREETPTHLSQVLAPLKLHPPSSQSTTADCVTATVKVESTGRLSRLNAPA